MNIVNANINKRKGKWTREQGKERSIIDYVTTSQSYMQIIKSTVTGEEKKRSNKQTKKIYSDHTAIF